MFGDIFSILVPVFVCVGIGYGWSKSGRAFDTPMVTTIVTYFGTPCLVFYALAKVELDTSHLWNMGLAALWANLAFAVIGAVALAIFKLPQRAFLQALTWPNVGNVGLPLCLLAFGQEGLALAIAFFTVYVVLQMTIGVAFVSGSFSPKSILKMPIIPATLLASLFLFSDLEVPVWLFNTTKLIGDLTIPLMLFTLGVSLASLKMGSLKTAVWLSVLRLGMGFGVGVALVALMGLSGPAAGVVILECAMPAAVFCYLFAQLYDQRPEEVAGLVIVSTFMGFAALPALLWYVL
ncbi:Auxin efflux carrier protein [Candidatus Terasakiella magnetica]|uniref:Auxin efflux carrier protein n=1 Tax=Candidatus Terasakiella magnetica TaxID=1867952 RepID=A0A1C3RDK8_9PROT|nr:AEC family transporter [Candidatus Terasakiella magnetica]SCA55345.1 Auxin efflux carrier protein [Candidatus Terasakiella magnetica]